MYAEDGSQILLTANSILMTCHNDVISLAPSPDIAAFPESVNSLGGPVIDVRTPDKLIDSYHDTTEGAHMWLAPILPDIVSPTHNDHVISLVY